MTTGTFASQAAGGSFLRPLDEMLPQLGCHTTQLALVDLGQTLDEALPEMPVPPHRDPLMLTIVERRAGISSRLDGTGMRKTLPGKSTLPFDSGMMGTIIVCMGTTMTGAGRSGIAMLVGLLRKEVRRRAVQAQHCRE